MKKLTALILILATVLSVSVSSVTAYEPDDQCLLYGYDPDERDDYETYGDGVFLSKNPEIKSPSGELYIWLNEYASRNIAKAAAEKGSWQDIITEEYFPELEIEEIYSNVSDLYRYEKDGIPYPGYEWCLHINIKLEDHSKDGVRNALIALAPRIDVDILSVSHYSYDLHDVSNALKYIAGWGDDYYRTEYDRFVDGEIDLHDISYMLKVIVGWDMPLLISSADDSPDKWDFILEDDLR